MSDDTATDYNDYNDHLNLRPRRSMWRKRDCGFLSIHMLLFRGIVSVDLDGIMHRGRMQRHAIVPVH